MKFIFKYKAIIPVFLYISISYFCDCCCPGYQTTTNKITKKIARQLKEQKNLLLVGTGESMSNRRQIIALSFYFYQEVDLNKARELTIHATNEYLSEINNNIRIRPWLFKYPLTAKNVEMRIWVHKPDGSHPPLDKIFYISAIEGILTYYQDLPETHSRQVIWEETYEEALQAVSSNK